MRAKNQSQRRGSYAGAADRTADAVQRVRNRLRTKLFVNLEKIDQALQLKQEGFRSGDIEVVLGLSRHQISRAEKAQKSGREFGRPGRPTALKTEQETQVKEAIKQAFETQQSWTIQRINDEVALPPYFRASLPSFGH